MNKLPFLFLLTVAVSLSSCNSDRTDAETPQDTSTGTVQMIDNGYGVQINGKPSPQAFKAADGWTSPYPGVYINAKTENGEVVHEMTYADGPEAWEWLVENHLKPKLQTVQRQVSKQGISKQEAADLQAEADLLQRRIDSYYTQKSGR